MKSLWQDAAMGRSACHKPNELAVFTCKQLNFLFFKEEDDFMEGWTLKVDVFVHLPIVRYLVNGNSH